MPWDSGTSGVFRISAKCMEEVRIRSLELDFKRELDNSSSRTRHKYNVMYTRLSKKKTKEICIFISILDQKQLYLIEEKKNRLVVHKLNSAMYKKCHDDYVFCSIFVTFSLHNDKDFTKII